MTASTEYLYLTTTGRVSGRPHEIEIWYVAYQGRYYLISGQREASDWVKNLRVQPQVTWRVGDQRFTGSARALDDAAEPELANAVRTLMQAKYQWSDGLVVELAYAA